MTPKPQNQNVRMAILKHKLRTGQLATKRTKVVHPNNVITKRDFERNSFEYKTKNQ
jgi:hypothetical protein